MRVTVGQAGRVVVELGVVLLLVLTPFAFGSVHEISYTAMELGLWGMALVALCEAIIGCGGSSVRAGWARQEDRRGRLRFVLGLPGTYFVAFLVFALLQMVLMPMGLVLWLSPLRAKLDQRFRVEPLVALMERGAKLPLGGRGGVAEGRRQDAKPQALTLRNPKDGRVALSVNCLATRIEWYKCLAYLCAFALVAGYLRSWGSTRRIVYAIIAVGVALACLGLYQRAYWGGKIYGFWESELGGTPFGPYVNRNHFAGYMAMVIPLALAQFLAAWDEYTRSASEKPGASAAARAGRAESRFRRSDREYSFSSSPRSAHGWHGRGSRLPWLGRSLLRAAAMLVCALVMAAALFASLSRGGILAFLFAAVVLAAFAMMRSKHRRATVRAAVVGLAVVVVVGLYSGRGALLSRFVTIGTSQHRGASRLNLWRQSVRIWRDFPIFGVGLGCFGEVYPNYKRPFHTEKEDIKAHNDYLQALVETGIVGLAILLLAAWAVLWPAVRAILQSSAQQSAWLLMGLVAGWLAMLAHSFVDFNLAIPANALLFSVLAGLIRNATHHVAQSRDAAYADSAESFVQSGA